MMRLFGHAVHPDALRLCLATFLNALPLGYLLIVLPLYLDQIGIRSAEIGWLYTFSGLVSAVLLVIFGVVADRVGRKPFVLIGLGLPVVSYVLLVYTTDLFLLTLAAGIGGVGLANGLSGALSGAGFNALLAEKTTDQERSFVFSLGSAAWTFALMVGSLLAALPEWLRARGWALPASYHVLFWLSFVVTALSALMIVSIREEYRPPCASPGWRGLVPRRSLAPILRLSLFMGLVGLGLGFSVQMLPLWFKKRYAVGEAFLGPWSAAAQAVSVTVVVVVPWLIRRLGTPRTLVLTQGVATLFLAALVSAPLPELAGAFNLLRQWLMNLAWPAQQSFIMGVAHPADRAVAGAVTIAAWGLFSALSPFVSGVWLDAGLLDLPILAGAASYLASVLVFWFFFRKTQLA